jgi:tetratricopeptide (TPR) repeat protein
MTRLVDALSQYPDVGIFAVLNSDADDASEWDVMPIDGTVLTESKDHDFFIVKAKNILPDGTVADCYIDMCLPERISDYAYFIRGNGIDVRYHHEFEGEMICTVPVDCFGVYELFYSRTAPEIGIKILRQGLAVSPHKTYIAEDLGYILRDEHRFAEAADMFQIAVDGEPSSYFIYGELAGCYDKIGQTEKANKYREMFDRAE